MAEIPPAAPADAAGTLHPEPGPPAVLFEPLVTPTIPMIPPVPWSPGPRSALTPVLIGTSPRRAAAYVDVPFSFVLPEPYEALTVLLQGEEVSRDLTMVSVTFDGAARSTRAPMGIEEGWEVIRRLGETFAARALVVVTVQSPVDQRVQVALRAWRGPP